MYTPWNQNLVKSNKARTQPITTTTTCTMAWQLSNKNEEEVRERRYKKLHIIMQLASSAKQSVPPAHIVLNPKVPSDNV